MPAIKPQCNQPGCGKTLEAAGGMPEDTSVGQTFYYVCPEHGTDYLPQVNDASDTDLSGS